jgi:hypothetical protein
MLVRFQMRTLALTAILLMFTLVIWAQAQQSPPSRAYLVIHISSGPTCSVQRIVAPCGQIGARMRAQNIPVQSRIAIHVNHDAQLEGIHLTSQSLQEAGFTDVSFTSAH